MREHRPSRRRLLKTGAALATGTAIAGCTSDDEERPVSTPDSDDNSSDDSGSDEDSEPESEGLELGFNWDDVLEAEQDYFEFWANYVPMDHERSALEIADPSHLENADPTDYGELQDALVDTLNPVVKTMGNVDPDTYSSSKTNGGSAAVNVILSDVLEDQEMKAKMMPVSWSGHGYTQVASTEHPLTLVDSNTDSVGSTTERPLNQRNDSDVLNDYVADMQDQDYADIDNRTKKALVRSFPNSIYSRDIEEEVYMVFDGSIVDDIYDQAILTEDGSLFMNEFRDAVAITQNMLIEDVYNEDNVAITSSPEQLPERTAFDSLGLYAEEIMDNHTKQYETVDELVEDALDV